jgi:hypothetical protein
MNIYAKAWGGGVLRRFCRTKTVEAASAANVYQQDELRRVNRVGERSRSVT